MTLKHFIKKNSIGVEDKFEEMKRHVELAKNRINFLDNFNIAIQNFEYINGYIFALYTYGIITKEEYDGLFDELLEARRINPKE